MNQQNDIALIWMELGADIRAEAGDLLAEGDLTTAVILSLMCDARAREDDIIPDGTGNRRGWWADTVAPLPATGLAVAEAPGQADSLGSRLWLLHRELQAPDVLRRARDYAQEALQWMIADGVARAVAVTPSIPRQGWLALDIVVTLSAGGGEKRLNFAYPYI